MPLYLETPCVKPKDACFNKASDIAEIYNQFTNPNLKVCIDTAHLWGSGVNISSYQDAKNWLHELDTLAPNVKNDIVLHLNDSTRKLGCGNDKHAPLFYGDIWGAFKDDKKQSGAYCFIQYAIKNKIYMILERPDKEMIQFDIPVMKELLN